MAESRRTQMTKHLFRKALIELLQEKPLHKITIKEICEQADLNRATFYLHYSDQSDLFNEIIALFEEDIKENIKKLTGEGDKIVLMSKYLDYVKDNSVLYRMLMSDDTVAGTKTTIIRDVISELRAEMPVYGNARENRYIYTYMIEGICGVIQSWIDHDFDMTSKDLSKLIDNLYIRTNR